MDKDTLQKQLEGVVKGGQVAEPKTTEKERAMQAVQQAFYEGF